jgi:hypothetical protein
MILGDIGLGELLWSLLIIYLIFAYLMILFSVIMDLFRDHELSGGYKALWVIFILFFPFLSLIVYLIARGGGMAKRNMERAQAAQAGMDEYVRNVAGASPADQIARGKELLDQGAIDAAEFEAIKRSALG